MYANRLTDFLQYLFGFRRRLALQPVRVRLLLGAALIPSVLMFAQTATASVLATGSYSPADNPFTLNINEGMPTDGNFVNPFEPIDAQTYFEGRHSDGVLPSDPLDDNNINFDIRVGITSSGTMLISGESALRDQDLVIGDSGTLNGQTRLGTGVVRITGFGSLYNNDPNILPAEVVAAGPTFKSKTPRLLDTGFDLLVGYRGTGTLEITAGARAEIQDAVAVGDQAGAVGTLIVDGVDSFLGSGGFPVQGGGGGGGNSGNRTEFHQMIIGRQGTGTMIISAGATVNSEAPPVAGGGGNTTGPVGAVLGSSPYSETLGEVPDPGGSGTATVTGPSSKWIVGGSLQVGGFDIGLSGGTTVGSIEGAPPETHYNAQVGSGTLYVNDGALVNVRNAIGVVAGGGGQQTDLILGIGRFGVLQLNGGTIRVGNVTGSADEATPDTVQIINDGVIRGNGRIDTGVFRNRYLGQVRVDAGQSLVINSTSEFITTGGNTPAEPLVNYGSIQVLGTSQGQAQLEFVRAPSDPLGTSPVRPFLNLPLSVALPQPSFTGGQISAQYANLRFGSGLINGSMLAFTAGTSNVVGRVVNVGLDVLDPSGDEGDGGDTAQMLVSGPGTTAVFHDDLSFGPLADLNLVDGGKVVVLNQHSFTMAGNLAIELSYSNPSLITVAGDVGIGPGTGNNDLSISLGSDVLHTLQHGDAFKIIAYTGDIGGVNTTIPTRPIVDYSTAPLFTDIDYDPNVSLLPLVPQVQFANQGVYVVFLDPALVGGPGGPGAIAPDFNGDGVVDLADFAIWNTHKGQMAGASVLDGDTDGDGDVDGIDFLFWQRNVGRPMPWTGSGSGSGSGTLVTIPEPASLMLLACGGALALAYGRRRSKR